MGRKKGSKNRFKRGLRKDAYQTYSDWYDKYTKGHKAGWFRPKYTKQEFDQEYKLAKLSGEKVNIARTIARSQEYVDRKFEKRYKEMYGKELPDIRKKEDREKLFLDFYGEMATMGLSHDEAEREFYNYFY